MLRNMLIAGALACWANAALADTLSLFDVYAQALESDPRVKIAQHKVEMSEARKDGATGQLLPQASFSGQWSDNEVDFINTDLASQSYNGERYGIQVRQMLFNWSTISARSRAKQVVAQSEAELLDVMGILLVDVAERYFQVLLADGDLQLITAERELVQQQVKETEELFERKLVRITDFLETQARADKVRTDLIEAENLAALSRENLSELTGTIIGDVAPIREDFTLPRLEQNMEYWTEQSLASNAMLVSKREAVEAADKAVQEQKGGHYPTLDLVISTQRSDIGFDNQASPARDTEYVGLNVNVPIFAGGSTRARVREAWSQYYIAREEEEAARREVLKRTREAWLNTRSSRKRIDSAELSVRSAAKSYEAMSKSFTYGTVTASDVLAALHAQTRAQRDYQDALYSYLVNWMALKRESGSLTSGDLEQLNEWLMADNA